jgi:hypothetical protein
MKIEEVGDMLIISGEVECGSCDGTGLYVGFAEQKGSAVICNRCGGTGKVDFFQSFQKFNGKKEKYDIKRVYDNSHGYVISAEDCFVDGKLFPFSQAGIDYDSWFKEDKKPVPMKFLLCPYLHTDQSLQTKDKNNLYKHRCKKNVFLGSSINKCKFFKNKETCWEIYDGEIKL